MKVVALTRELGSTPIFVTQRSARWKNKDNEIYGAETDEQIWVFKGNKFKFNNSDIWHTEKLVSEKIMSFCEDNGIYCIDGVSTININVNNTYDLVHTNVEGSKEISKVLFKRLNRDIKL